MNCILKNIGNDGDKINIPHGNFSCGPDVHRNLNAFFFGLSGI